jgi:hypothetical protein
MLMLLLLARGFVATYLWKGGRRGEEKRDGAHLYSIVPICTQFRAAPLRLRLPYLYVLHGLYVSKKT